MSRFHIRVAAFAIMVVIAVCLSAMLPVKAGAEELMTAVPFAIVLDGEAMPEDVTLGAYTNNRDNMMYLSLRDLAQVVSGTPAQFQFALDEEDGSFLVTKGAP